MNRHQRFYARLFPKEPPRYVKRALWPRDMTKRLPKVRRTCDYCEAYGMKDKDGKPLTYLRALMTRFPTGILSCGNHGTVKERQMEGFLGAYERLEAKERETTDDGSDQ